jgi:acetyl-CoA C-acetyltransferase
LNRVYIISSTRTPIGIFNGHLKDYNEQTLGAISMTRALSNAKIEADQIDEVVIGTAKQTSLPSNCARHAMLVARLPVSIPAYTVHRQSASGLQAIANGFWSIKSKNTEIVMVGGTESMTQIPREIHDARYVFNQQTKIIFDPIPAQLSGAQPAEQYGNITAERVSAKLAKEYDISDQEQVAFAKRSVAKARANKEKNNFIIPFSIKKKKDDIIIQEDELYSEVSKTASPADAAAVSILASSQKAMKLNLPILGEILSVGISAGDPTSRGMVGGNAVYAALKKAGMTVEEIDLIKVNEMSAAQCIAMCRELQRLGLSDSDIEQRVNTTGGALATGNAWGASGAVLFTDMISDLRNKGLTNGLIVAPAEGGQTMAVIIQRK